MLCSCSHQQEGERAGEAPNPLAGAGVSAYTDLSRCSTPSRAASPGLNQVHNCSQFLSVGIKEKKIVSVLTCLWVQDHRALLLVLCIQGALEDQDAPHFPCFQEDLGARRGQAGPSFQEPRASSGWQPTGQFALKNTIKHCSSNHCTFSFRFLFFFLHLHRWRF